MKPETQKLKRHFYKQLTSQGANYQFAAIAAEALAKEQLEGYERNEQDHRAINECHKAMTTKKDDKPQKPSDKTKTFDINQENHPEIWALLQPPKNNAKS